MVTPRPLAGLAAGIVAGLAASAAMAAFQSVASRWASRDDESEPATEQAADAIAKVVTGDDVPASARPMAGQAVHYVTGAALGGIYGVLNEYRPDASAGFGAAYGVATSAIVDEAAVPALGLGDAPWQATLGSHAYRLASHLVYGVVLEGVRSLLAGRR